MERTTQPLPRNGYGALYTEHQEAAATPHLAPPFREAYESYDEVVITAGGTQEPIDDVRYVGNFSSGRFGHALAEEYASHGHQVTLIAPNSVVERFGKPDNIKHITFTSAESLRQAFLTICGADLILHAAAVADYTPMKVQGKISSDQERLTIEMERTPKILALLRKYFSAHTTIVGFKLLSGVSTEHLTEVARKQIVANQTDYAVANLLDDINGRSGEREVRLISTDGEVQVFGGKTVNVAQGLYKAIKWASSNEALRG
jgi:phosphopantothenoylcysteine synthetase/decarboxylase